MAFATVKRDLTMMPDLIDTLLLRSPRPPVITRANQLSEATFGSAPEYDVDR